jgi:hypothetical protein
VGAEGIEIEILINVIFMAEIWEVGENGLLD